MKKVLKSENHSHLLAGLIFVASSIVLVFVCLFNIYNPVNISVLYEPDISQITYIPNPPELQNQPTNAYTNYALKHKWVATKPKTEWEKNELPTYSTGNEKCFIAKTSVFPMFTGGNYKQISFNYALCPHNSPIFYTFTEPNVIYSSWNSEAGGLESSASPAMRYWNLGKDDNPELFITLLMQSLPTEIQRDHCKLDSKGASLAKTPKGNYTHYTVSPDATYIKALAAEGKESGGACYPYSNYFELVGNTLIYIYNSQDVTLFDPDSIKVSISSSTVAMAR